jgi:hypothetical protein
VSPSSCSGVDPDRRPLHGPPRPAIRPRIVVRALQLALFAAVVFVTTLALPRAARAESTLDHVIASFSATNANAQAGDVSRGDVSSSDASRDRADFDPSVALASTCLDDSPRSGVFELPAQDEEPCIRAARVDGIDAPAPLCGDDATSLAAPGIVRRGDLDRMEASSDSCPKKLSWLAGNRENPPQDAPAELTFEPASLPAPLELPAARELVTTTTARLGLAPCEGVARGLSRPPAAR